MTLLIVSNINLLKIRCFQLAIKGTLNIHVLNTGRDIPHKRTANIGSYKKMDKTGIRGFQYNIRLAVMFLKQVLRILSQVAGFTNYKGKRTNILKFQHGDRMTIRLALVRYVNL